MHIYKDINNLPHFKKAVITVGSFDGVHPGHKKILEQLLKEASQINGTAVLITFFPHPRQVLQKNTNPVQSLTTAKEKYAMLQQAGIEHLVEIPFDENFSRLTAEEYIQDFLVKKIKVDTIITGYDHRFGNKREGDYQLLETAAARYNFKVKEIPAHILKDVTISSTKIREALLLADLATAAAYLDYDYFFSATVVQGNKIGNTLGYPTANLELADKNKLIPGNGVYAVEINLENCMVKKGMMNIGVRPTIHGSKRMIEVNIFDFKKDIYGQKIKIIMKKWLRNEKKFDGLDMLKQQLQLDEKQAKGFFKMH